MTSENVLSVELTALAIMRGSSCNRHSNRLLTDLAGVIKENFDLAKPNASAKN
ncbi:MAG TPA: hypothetical protein PKD54_09095 [Pirellulaceae bacterium]|nr:hypothetical protein [Pirellulaceae bacterium]